MAKPTEPNISIPQGFANEGQKTDFLEEKIQKGFDPVDPDVLAGDNLNKFIDDTYKGLNYTIDSVNDLYKGAVLYDVRENYSSTSIVFNIEDDGIFIYKSLTDDNLGNPLSDETKWKKVDLGDGGGGDTGGGFSLFDVVEKDHILSFEESMGFGLLGTYVYKEPVAGSRYGYPDFYNECVAQKSTEGNTLLALKNNVEVVGSPVVNNGVLSGFSSTTWANLPKAFNPSNKNWEMFYKFKTGTIGTIQYILNTISAGYQPFDIRIGEDGKLQVASFINNTSTPLFSIIGTTALTPATDYYVKLAYNSVTGYELSLGTSKDNLLIEGTNNTTTAINSGSIPTLGADFNNDGNYFQGAFTGSIDLKECYIKIDNELWWSGATTATKNPNGHIFYDIADKATVDEIFAQRGEAWFYGVDTENERVFLPRGTRSQYTVNTDETGDYVEAGLPNIAAKDSIGFSDDNPTSDLPPFVFDSVVGNSSGGPSGEKRFKFDASTVNTIYGNSDTVQPYATKKLLYIVVGNVKVQSAASDVVDVTTTENDTVPLFTGQYFNFKPNNPSWLKAGEQQDSGGLYASTYSTLVHELTDPVYNLKVIKTEDMQAGVDYSLYWKVDQDAQTFTTPTKLGNEGMFSTACKGNGVTLGLTNGSNSYGFGYSTNAANYNQTNSGLYGTPIGTQISGQPNNWPYNSSLGITPDPTKSGIVPHIEVPESWNLYFKVSNALENLEVINVGQILEALTDKLDKNHSNDTKPYIVEQYQNPNAGTAAGNAGYRKWSNGMMEQWASSDNIGPDSKTTISFLIPFYQNVCVYAQQITGGHASSAGTWSVDAVSSNNFELINYTDVISAVYWFAIGRYQK